MNKIAATTPITVRFLKNSVVFTWNLILFLFYHFKQITAILTEYSAHNFLLNERSTLVQSF